MGVLGSSGSYMATWGILSFQTISALGKSLPKSADGPDKINDQLTTRHCLMAIWMWRHLLSTIESISFPPFFSVIGFILTYLLSYFLWVTAFVMAMLITPKAQKDCVSEH